jgi:hypothetical protein
MPVEQNIKGSIFLFFYRKSISQREDVPLFSAENPNELVDKKLCSGKVL